MKKKNLASLILASVMTFTLVGCGGGSSDGGDTSSSDSSTTDSSTADTSTTDTSTEGSTTESTFEHYFALVTDVGNIDDQSFNQGSYEGMVKYAESQGIDYGYFRPSEDTTASRVETIETAINDNGATAVVLPGYMFAEGIPLVQDKYPDVMFLGIDVVEADILAAGAEKVSDNVALINYKEEQSGYLAGYAAVRDGYTQLGFLGGIDVPAVIRFGYGFVQGADDAATEMGVEAHMKYMYGGVFTPDDNVKVKMDSWFADGTEVVHTCGGGIWLSAAAAAEVAGGVLIGCDVDQGPQHDLFISSAMKELGNSVELALSDLVANDGKWSEAYAGQQSILGAAEGAVGLPLGDSWGFTTFTEAEYQELFDRIVAGEIEISNDTENRPELTTLTVDYQS